MVHIQVNLSEKANRTISMVKAANGLSNKAEAIQFVIEEYSEELMEPELRPEYIEKLKKIEKEGKYHKFSSIDDLRKEIENT